MPIEYLKKANPPIQAIDTATADTVRGMLDTLLEQGEAAARAYARDLDGWSGDIVVGEEAFAKAEAALAQRRQGRHSFCARPGAGLCPAPARFDAGVLSRVAAGAHRRAAPDSVQHRGLLRAGWPLCACRQRHHECRHRLGGGREEHHRRHAGAQGGRHPPRRSCTRCTCAACRRCSRWAACRAWRRWPTACSAASRPTSSSARATASWRRPSACCSAGSASTWWPARPNRR